MDLRETPSTSSPHTNPKSVSFVRSYFLFHDPNTHSLQTHTHTHIHAASVNSRRIIYYLMLIILSFPRAVRVSLVFYFNSIFYFVSTPFVCVYLFNCLTLYYHYRRQLYNNKKNYTIYIIFYSFILALKVKSIYVHVCVLEKR